MDIKGYLKRRMGERSTMLGIAMVGVQILTLVFPEHAFIINQVALALGLTTAAVPDKQKKQ